MKIEKKMLAELEKNSRVTNLALAKKLGVSEGTVRNKIAKLVSEGYIKRFTVDRSLKFGFGALVHLNNKPQVRSSRIAEELKKIKGIKKVYETAGDYDMVLEIFADSPEDFNEIIESIRDIEGILNTNSLTVLKVD